MTESYTIAETGSVSFHGYERVVTRIVVPNGRHLSVPQRTEILVEVLENGFVENPTADAILVFAYSAPMIVEQGGAFDVGRIQASRDGKRGWNSHGGMVENAKRDRGLALVTYEPATGAHVEMKVKIARKPKRKRLGVL